MNSVQIHLALTHVPVILSLVGLVILIASGIVKNPTLVRVAYAIIVVAGIAALPVFFSGEGAEEAIEHLPGVSETLIERHEDAAKLAMFAIVASALAALAAIVALKWKPSLQFFKVGVLALSIGAGALMAQTAHLGGQIRHPEMRNGATASMGAANEYGGDNDE